MNIDSRWTQLADILVHYSTDVRRGDRVLISMQEIHTFDLVRALHASIVAAGGLPFVEFQSAYLERDLLLAGSEEQVAWVSEPTRSAMRWADVYIGVRGSSNPALLRDVAAQRVASRRKASGTLSALRTNNTRWVLIRVPNDAMAQQAQLGSDEMMQLFFAAVLRDWGRESAEFERIRARLEGAGQLRIVAPGTDLSFATSGRSFLSEDGHINMPGGEIYTSPVEDSAEGHITFSFPGVFAGQSVEGIELELAAGRVVTAKARGNQELLDRLLDMDRGARRIGEFGIGLNRGLNHVFRDPLFDEKIWGTVHLALGRSYPACGGRNRSSLHWDVVTDLRSAGSLLVDGVALFRDGRFVGA